MNDRCWMLQLLSWICGNISSGHFSTFFRILQPLHHSMILRVRDIENSELSNTNAVGDNGGFWGTRHSYPFQRGWYCSPPTSYWDPPWCYLHTEKRTMDKQDDLIELFFSLNTHMALYSGVLWSWWEEQSLMLENKKMIDLFAPYFSSCCLPGRDGQRSCSIIDDGKQTGELWNRGCWTQMAPGSSHALYGDLHGANWEQLVQRKPQMPVFIAPGMWKQPQALFSEHRSYCVVLRQMDNVASP